MPDPKEQISHNNDQPTEGYEKLEFKTPKEQLAELRKQVEAEQLSKDPKSYDHPKTKLMPSDKLNVLLDKIFPKGTPKAAIARIEKALNGKGIDFNEIQQKYKITDWEVKDGKMHLTSESNPTTEIVFDILPWTALTTSAEVLEEHTDYYDLEKHDGAVMTPGSKAESITGSVDATRHNTQERPLKWYEAKRDSADLLMDLFFRSVGLDPATMALVKANEAIIKDLASQSGNSPATYKAFEKKYSNDQIFGPNGVYNIILAFQRILDGEPSIKKGSTNVPTISINIGKKQDTKAERFVKEQTKSNLTDEDGHINLPGKTPSPTYTPPEPDATNKGDHLAVKTKSGSLLPSADQFNEQVDTDATSTELLRSYKEKGASALLEGLAKIPENQREAVLGDIFKKIGESDPEKAYNLLLEIIKTEKGNMEQFLVMALDEKIKNAPDEHQKNFWTIQKLLNETSQAGDIDPATGAVRMTHRQSQAKMQEIFSLIEKTDETKLPNELKDWFKSQKEYLEVSFRTSMSMDLLDTANMTMDRMMQAKKSKDTWFEDSFEELSKKSRPEIAKELNGGIDQDSEVFLASSHVFEAIRLLIMYQYPKDVQDSKQIQNPIQFYYNQLKEGVIKVINLPKDAEGKEQTVEVRDILGQYKSATGKIELDQLFVDSKAELDLFEQYQSGKEKLGPDSVWNAVEDTKEGAIKGVLGRGATGDTVNKYIGLVPGLWGLQAARGFSDNREGFMQKQGGIIEGSESVFPPLGQLSKLINENPGGDPDDLNSLGASQRLEVAKIGQLIHMGHYDEARSLCISILQEKLDAKKKHSEAEITKKMDEEIAPDYRDKLSAQVSLSLKAEGITLETLTEKDIKKPDGTPYSSLNEYINAKAELIMKEMAYLRLQDENANSLTDADTAGMTAFEKSAYEQLQFLNGHTAGSAYLTKEHLDVVKEFSKMVVEIIIIEVATMGTGAAIAGAAGAARAGTMGMRGVNLATKSGQIGFKMGEGARALVAGTGIAGRFPRLAGVAGRGGRAIRYIAEGETAVARGAGQVLHGAAFVQAQNMMHGEPTRIASAEGVAQVAATAATMYGLGKMQEFMRGATRGATGARTAVTTRGLSKVDNLLIGASRRTGALTEKVASSGKLGYVAISGAEIGTEIAALHYLGEAQNYLMYSAEERAAMHDPDAFNRWAHTAGVVVGLRTFRRATKTVEPPPPPPPPPEPRGMRMLPPGPNPPKQLPAHPEMKQITGRPAPEQLSQRAESIKAKQRDLIAKRNELRQQRDTETDPAKKEAIKKELHEINRQLNILDTESAKKPTETKPSEPTKTNPETTRPTAEQAISQIDKGQIPKEYPADKAMDKTMAERYWKKYGETEGTKNGDHARRVIDDYVIQGLKPENNFELTLSERAIQDGTLSAIRQRAREVRNIELTDFTIEQQGNRYVVKGTHPKI